MTDILKITELQPWGPELFAGKTIRADGTISPYDNIKRWRQRVVEVPAEIPALCEYIRQAREQNTIIIRGAPANVTRQPTFRQIAYTVDKGKDRGDHGFVPQLHRMLALDLDGVAGAWQQQGLEAAITGIVQAIGPPFSEASFVWFPSSSHGLKIVGGRWNGEISDDKIRARVIFITDRPIGNDAAKAWLSNIPRNFKVDISICGTEHINYITRPRWDGRPGEDPLGAIPTIGWVAGARGYLEVPDDMPARVKAFKAGGGVSGNFAYHPDLESAILAIGSDGVTRAHVGSALGHLQRANKKATAEELVVMLEDECNRHRAEIEDNLARNNESNEVWDDLVRYFPNDVAKAQWWIDRPAAPDVGGAAAPSSEVPAFTDVEKAREEMARAAINFLKYHVLCPEEESNPFTSYVQQNWEDLFDLALLPSIVARVTTGVGKTQQMVKAITKWLKLVEITSITYAVPRHKLGKKILQQFTEQGIFAKIIRGRHALDPRAHPDGFVKDGEPRVEMCLNPEAVKLAEELQLSVEESCCKNKNRECPFYGHCGYQQQKRGPKARVWIVASDMLFHELPLLKPTSAVIVDESIWQKGLDGFDGRYRIPIDSLRAPDVELPADESALRSARNKLANALARQEEDGGVGRHWLSNTFSRGELLEIRRREWDMLPKSPLQPGMTPEQVRRIARFNKPLLDKIRHSRKIIQIWNGVMELLGDRDLEVSGRLTLKRDAFNLREVEWRGVKEITEQFKVPTFLMDATAPDLKILRAFYPMAELGAEIDVEMPTPHVHVRQILKSPTSANKLLKPEDDKNREEIRRHILQRWLETGRADALVICQMKYQNWLEPKDANGKSLPRRLPDNIRVEHFNDITGIDDFRGVRLLLVIGRTAPGPRTDEAFAAALSGEQPVTMPEGRAGMPWYDRVPKGIRLRDGTGILTMVDKHRDPMAEAVRWQIHEAELIQAIGRARGVNRTAESPLDIDLLFDADLGITVDEVPTWDPPSPLIETAAAAGVILTAPTDLAREFPKIWPTKRAAERDLKAGVPKPPGFRAERYQAGGRRQKPRQAHTNLAPEGWAAWLAARGWKPADIEPWEAAGVSRATYFRRLKAKSAAR
jgi:hypothetical protein